MNVTFSYNKQQGYITKPQMSITGAEI